MTFEPLSKIFDSELLGGNNLADLLFYNSPNAVIVTDSKANILTCNDSFCKLNEYNLEELVGENMRFFNSGLTCQSVYDNLWETISKGDTWKGVFRNRTKSGQIYMENSVIVPIFDKDKSIIGYIGYKSDISHIEDLRSRANFDCLTKLPNRHSLEDNIGAFMNESVSNNSYMSLMFMDLDGFKPINDTYGHNVGDLVLEEVSKRFLSSLREKDFVARVGGDEFVCLLSGFDSKEKMVEISNNVAKRIGSQICRPYTFEDNICKDDVSLGVSIGVVGYPYEGIKTKEDYLNLADEVMYDVKNSGKNGYKIVY